MDGAAQNRPTQPAPQQQASLIRPEQVQRLPQLNPTQKQQFEQGVRRFWEILNTTPQTDPKYTEAYTNLVKTSSQLMAGMKQWQQRKQMAQQHAAQQQTSVQAQTQVQTQAQGQGQGQAPRATGQPAQPQAAAAQGQGGGSAVQFSQLLPEIQRKVNEQHFYYPPAMTKGSEPAEVWLREAKARLGQALQRLQVAKQKKAEFQRQAQQRQAAGNPLTANETEVYNNKIAQCDRAVNESTSFMKKFNEQQEQFRAAQPQHQFSKQGVPVGEGAETPAAPHMQPGIQAPTAHSISSAVSAARNQASAAQAGSPTAPAPQVGQGSGAVTQHTLITGTQTQFPQAGQGDTSAGPRPTSHQGQAMPPLQQAASAGSHLHPLNTSINGIKTATPNITKNLQVPEPKPVAMPPSRPTLTGGAGVGLPGQLAQPAITALPGYVLESSEDGRILSKKKLNELVREVCGPGPDEQLDPEAEEIFLSIADDFVDELVSSACKLAKLRGSSSLELRDIQIVLERQYNIRVPGISTDEIRTVRRPQPAPGWAHKMSAVQAAKLTGGGTATAATGTNGKEN
ncbi:transcription initiation factor TFIID subunit 12 [Cladophialophora psammophila CBS 110553]|uniref:Transcription initiation factor TFIID subunit 12 n=1 Tax=Cladophialophora psammophila CBS 110553 TaxID=1182543 RepID=W9VKH5_9EURO|nr:transcription initiation factor TFIID subunit 12 [Cladophialophora psammophila CBS 110553]EXJ53525.1 transcription initiation factor TFIID subunit 12 [Cladophialophora psammophila CBS 110553]